MGKADGGLLAIIFLALASYFQTPLAGLMWNDDANIRLNENFITFPTLIARWDQLEIQHDSTLRLTCQTEELTVRRR